MKNKMGIWGIIALIVVALYCVKNIAGNVAKNTQLDAVAAYLAAAYPGEKLTVTATHYGGSGAYAIVRPENQGEAYFRVFYNKNLTPYPYYDTYYSVKLIEPARAAVKAAMGSTMPQAKVLIKIWMLDNETLSGGASLDDYLATCSGSIGMYFALPAAQASAFTQENMQAVLNALSKAGLRGPVTFGVLKEGQSALGDIDVETNFSKWCKQTRTGRVQGDGSVTLK